MQQREGEFVGVTLNNTRAHRSQIGREGCEERGEVIMERGIEDINAAG